MVSMEQVQPNFDGMPLDCNTIAQELLNIDKKQRSNLFPWIGQFSPQLIEILLRTYSTKKGVVLDPFVGSGTVLHEAGRLGLPVVGAEINPAARKMAQIYRLMNLPLAQRKSLANQLDETLHECLPAREPSLFSVHGRTTDQDFKMCLVEICRNAGNEVLRSMVEALIVLVDFYREATGEKVYSTWSKLKSRILSLPESDAPVRLLSCDARRLSLHDGEADLVVTSPPYINVFNYHQQFRRSAEALGWDLLVVARSEIGANRKHRQNRFLTVIQYCLDMAEVLWELQRVSKEGSRMIVIVGRESKVRKTKFFNGEIVAALASRCIGLSFVSRQERVFTNRFGERIYEDLLHFIATEGSPKSLAAPRVVSQEILEKARNRAAKESLADLDEALSLVSKVQASPIYDQDTANLQTSDRVEARSKYERIPNPPSGETDGGARERQIAGL
jgi:hypothetical protein